jgi:hypothetical protein
MELENDLSMTGFFYVLKLYLRICTFEYACNLVTPFGMAATFSLSIHTQLPLWNAQADIRS